MKRIIREYEIHIGEGLTDTALLEHVGRSETGGCNALCHSVALTYLNCRLVVVKEGVKFLFKLN